MMEQELGHIKDVRFLFLTTMVTPLDQAGRVAATGDSGPTWHPL